MSEGRPRKLPSAKKRGILSEETVQRAGQPDVTNPYWLDEEPDEHPNPELGCVRRGLCCRTHPGSFAPGEVEKAAALLGLEPDAFVRRYVVVTSVEIEGREVPTFSPVKLDRRGDPMFPPGTQVDRLYYLLRGPCVFFEGEGCRIYEARPLECARYVCTNAPGENLSKEELGRLWLESDTD